jgi:hypothetical protein
MLLAANLVGIAERDVRESDDRRITGRLQDEKPAGAYSLQKTNKRRL